LRRFFRNIDLGILHFYFSSENCSSKVYTSLGKVVALVTRSTAKLGLLFLDFSVICYGFYKVLPKHIRSGRFILRKAPLERKLVKQLGPWLQLAAILAGIRQDRQRSRSGRWRITARGSLRIPWRPELRRRQYRRASSTAASGDGRGYACSDELARRPRQEVAVGRSTTLWAPV
jgi:hypothetical protein